MLGIKLVNHMTWLLFLIALFPKKLCLFYWLPGTIPETSQSTLNIDKKNSSDQYFGSGNLQKSSCLLLDSASSKQCGHARNLPCFQPSLSCLLLWWLQEQMDSFLGGCCRCRKREEVDEDQHKSTTRIRSAQQPANQQENGRPVRSTVRSSSRSVDRTGRPTCTTCTKE